MANSLYTAAEVVKLGSALLTADLVLAASINRDYEDNYGGGHGTTVNVRVPAVLKAKKRDLTNSATTGQLSAFVVSALNETTFAIELDSNPYQKVALNQRERTFDLENFGEQVLAPQVASMVEEIEDSVATEFLALPETNSLTLGAYSPTNPTLTFSAIRKALRDNGMPMTGLRAAVGTKVWKDMVDAKVFSDLGANATNPAVPTSKNVGGFDAFETNRIGEEDIVFYHRDAFTLAVRSPEAPADGIVFAASLSANGFSLQHIQDYDSSIGQHTSLVQTFTGVSYLPARKIDRSGAEATIVEVPSAYRIDTGTAAA
ncbi:P22 phage major capsid protein family protein [Kribbella sp. CA-293567]|uniref:P22 phage major capsid protein family protein n=1 Tax=Kribbella sp. CA-293567 TaxID=3002436 RepID=UPI0022DE49AF|nr:P22 phage major capsid protein family protein [Kribbella sp. CA-293567]WBQ03782.1 hypothetical protein OX958_27910 [Kribbella sp. CA-293567]